MQRMQVMRSAAMELYEFVVKNKEFIAMVLAVALGQMVQIRAMNSFSKTKHWREVSKKVRQARDDKEHISLQKASAIAKEDIDSITKMSIRELKLSMHNGEVTCEKIMLCFIRKSREIGLYRCNALAQEMYDEAWSSAKKLDQSGLLRTTPIDDEKLPLLGIPLSVKDSIEQKGAACTCGVANRSEKQLENDGLLIELLRKAGAIPFVRTNVPQMLMMTETENLIFGRTINPWNKERTPGGSSGGEGALISARGSVLGIGSDIGGSLRIPSHFCGIVAFKPTPERITSKGLCIPRKGNKSGQKIIKAVAGPMANSVQDCEIMMRAINGPNISNLDPYVPPIEWDSKLANEGPGRPIKLCMIKTDRFFKPCKTVERALGMAAKALKDKGHQIFEVDCPDFATGFEICKLYYGQMAADGNMKGFVDGLEGEKLIGQYKRLKFFADLPNFIRSLLSKVLRLLGHVRHSNLIELSRNGGTNVRQYWSYVADHFEIREKYSDFMQKNSFDGIVMPPAALCAMPHMASKDLTPICSYMFLANILHFPAGVVPVTKVRADEQSYFDDSDLPLDQRCMLAKKARQAMVGSEGMPCGVQILTMPWKDELCMFAMKELEDGLKEGDGRENFIPSIADFR